MKLSDSPEGTVVEVRKGKESAAEGATKQTFVLSYTMADWEAWKEAVPEHSCLLSGMSDDVRLQVRCMSARQLQRVLMLQVVVCLQLPTSFLMESSAAEITARKSGAQEVKARQATEE